MIFTSRESQASIQLLKEHPNRPAHTDPFPVTVWLQYKMSPEELSSSHLAPRELRSLNLNKCITERSVLMCGWFMLLSLYLYFSRVSSASSHFLGQRTAWHMAPALLPGREPEHLLRQICSPKYLILTSSLLVF